MRMMERKSTDSRIRGDVETVIRRQEGVRDKSNVLSLKVRIILG